MRTNQFRQLSQRGGLSAAGDSISADLAQGNQFSAAPAGQQAFANALRIIALILFGCACNLLQPPHTAEAAQSGTNATDSGLLAQTPSASTASTTEQPAATALLDVRHFGAKGDGVSDDTQAIRSALEVSRHVYFPAGTYLINDRIRVPDNTHVIGEDRTTTILRAAKRGFNMLVLGDTSSIEHLTVDGVFDDDIVGGSGIIFVGNDSEVVDVASINQGFQGFAMLHVSGNRILHSEANHCGHRGINISEGSHDNIVDDFRSVGCHRAGLLIGYNSYNNRISHSQLSGHDNAALWVHMGSHNNTITHVEIGPPSQAGQAKPQVIVGAGSYSNTFEDMTMTGGVDRALYIWNLSVDHPELGVSDRLINANRFINFRMIGSNQTGSRAIVIKGDQNHAVGKNLFQKFFIDGYSSAVDDPDKVADGLEFDDFQFGSRIPAKFLAPRSHLTNARMIRVQGMPDE